MTSNNFCVTSFLGARGMFLGLKRLLAEAYDSAFSFLQCAQLFDVRTQFQFRWASALSILVNTCVFPEAPRLEKKLECS